MSIVYGTQVTSIAGRGGKVTSQDGQLDLSLSSPGSGQPGTNPEQLFAAGYSACFGSAVALVAKQANVSTQQVITTISISLHKEEEEGYHLSGEIHVELKGVDITAAKKIVAKAHQVCPYSKATRGNMDIALFANGEKV